MIEDLRVNKKKSKHPKVLYKTFCKYTELLAEKYLLNLIKTVDDINLVSALTVMTHARFIVKRSNKRLVNQFSLMALESLFQERESAGSDFDQLCVTYFV